MKKIIECVPNFSEGRDPGRIDKIVESFRGKKDIKLLDYQHDEDHNRMVVTVIGEPDALKDAIISAVGAAIDVIDLRKHEGQHPRMGAVDVVPFIPIKNVTMDEAIEFSREVAENVSKKYNLPVFLFEKSAIRPERQNLADIRKGQFEGMDEKLRLPEWRPDFGPSKVHPTAGATAIGARMPLIAFNVNLDTNNLEIADSIAKKVRHIGGGLRYCKAMGVNLKDQGIVQVSMNMTDFTKTSLYMAFELIRIEARRFGASIVGSEIIGMVPLEALVDTAVYYLGMENFSMNQVLEYRIME
ncbi:MAG: glutamate formimidoyltransferase [Thermodesulfobacteriota bacterium]|nr:glutamate formimidoyltransferase [Thermodesulfobacteriota bacterium]